MPTELRTPNLPTRDVHLNGTVLVLVAGVCAAAAALYVSMSELPSSFILPVLSVFTFFAAATAAFVAWHKAAGQSASGVTYWDVVGALTIIAISAALLSDPEQVIPLLEQRHSQ